MPQTLKIKYGKLVESLKYNIRGNSNIILYVVLSRTNVKHIKQRINKLVSSLN